ncbi:MAG: NAD-dependent epimerase/dehydratase family protein [Pseudobdellovibrionaceae bacterium]
MNKSLNIVVAGASGYIGKVVIPELLGKFPAATVTALSRTQQSSLDPRVQWKACDLFSLKELEATLPKNIDLALYLVHSMGPTAQLDQGSFADYDLILADNFSRAMNGKGVKQLIYLGGLTPESKDLSLHLQSRLEVEETFAQYQLPTTIFRAGLILGDAGSSFQILLKLVKRLPLMICPQWTQTLTTPVDLPTVLNAIVSSALDEKHIHKIYDLAGCKPIMYIDMMRETARRIGKKRFFLKVPFFTPTLSRLWVSLITNTSKDLVYPLVESLEHKMVARPDHYFSNEWAERNYFDLLENASLKTKTSQRFFRFRARSKTVRSIQRLPLKPDQDAKLIKNKYIQWLPQFLSPVIKVRVIDSTVTFSIFTNKLVLLKLKLSEERSNDDRQLLYIIGGLLVANENRGRLEFRVVLNRKYVLAAIHDYTPALPWFIYRNSQALLHLLVMNAFRKYLTSTYA